MAKLLICMADGCEEIEALTVVDLARRAGLEIDMASVSGKAEVTGSHKIKIGADKSLKDIDVNGYDGVILPGGMPGTNYLREDAKVIETVKNFTKGDKLVAAICAAPTVLGYAGVLDGKNASCYPGMEDGLTGAKANTKEVNVDGNIITSRGLGTAIPFALAIIAYFLGEEKAAQISNSVVYQL